MLARLESLANWERRRTLKRSPHRPVIEFEMVRKKMGRMSRSKTRSVLTILHNSGAWTRRRVKLANGLKCTLELILLSRAMLMARHYLIRML